MSNKVALTAVVGAFVAGSAFAQARVEPQEPAAPIVAPAAQTSAFDGYRPYRDEPVAPWREVNDAVREAGGHVGILRAEQRRATPSAAQSQSGAPGVAPTTPQDSKQER